MERMEAFINEIREVVELRELRNRAQKAIPEANFARLFEDQIAERVAGIAKQVKGYNADAEAADAAKLAKHQKDHHEKKGAA